MSIFDYLISLNIMSDTNESSNDQMMTETVGSTSFVIDVDHKEPVKTNYLKIYGIILICLNFLSLIELVIGIYIIISTFIVKQSIEKTEQIIFISIYGHLLILRAIIRVIVWTFRFHNVWNGIHGDHKMIGSEKSMAPFTLLSNASNFILILSGTFFIRTYISSDINNCDVFTGNILGCTMAKIISVVSIINIVMFTIWVIIFRCEKINLLKYIFKEEHKKFIFIVINRFYGKFNIKILDSESFRSEFSCGICLDDSSDKMTNSNDEYMQLSCKHIFHSECIKKWLDQNNTCPICRNVVINSTNFTGLQEIINFFN